MTLSKNLSIPLDAETAASSIRPIWNRSDKFFERLIGRVVIICFPTLETFFIFWCIPVAIKGALYSRVVKPAPIAKMSARDKVAASLKRCALHTGSL